ncbi:MAG: hypothetical protein HMLKMBBP_02405 [Planctomycetes bacterium]|nr:hypothetical protein [Planctomycetota bacterium]
MTPGTTTGTTTGTAPPRTPTWATAFSRVLARRTALFLAVFVPGMGAVVWLSGGLSGGRRDAPPMPGVQSDPGKIAAVDRGSGVGPGSQGRLVADGTAIIGGKPVPWRQWVATWRTSDPAASDDPEVQALRLTEPRLVFFSAPEKAGDPVSAKEDAPGTTDVRGKTGLFRQHRSGSPTAHIQGDAAAYHRMDDGDLLVVHADSLDYAEEARGQAKARAQVVSTDDPVRIDAAGSTITGTGMHSAFEGRATRRAHVHLKEDVKGTFLRQAGKAGAAQSAVVVSCAGSCDLEALDAPAGRSRDGRQPWRAVFRKDVRFEEAGRVLAADEVVVEFVRAAKEDQKQGAQKAEIQRIVATGSVRVDGKDAGRAIAIECERLRQSAEDGRTDVMVLEGAQKISFDTAADRTRGTAPRRYTIEGKGPTTIRERRTLADRDSAALVTIASEGNPVCLETDAATGRAASEMKAARITAELRRDARDAAGAAPMTPTLLRGEGGATLRREELHASGATVVWTAPAESRREHIAIAGAPRLLYPDAEGVNPFDEGGRGKPGTVEITAAERIDVDLAPAAVAGGRKSGAHEIATTGRSAVRKLVGDEETLRLEADSIDARLDEQGRPRLFTGSGRARVRGRGEGDRPRGGDLSGDRIVVQRRGDAGGDAKRDDLARDTDVLVEASEAIPALAVFEDRTGSDDVRHEIRGRTIRATDGGARVHVAGKATVDIGLPLDSLAPARSARTLGAAKSAAADELRADFGPGKKGGSELVFLSLQGNASLRDARAAVRGDALEYDARTGKADASGRPAVMHRNDDPRAPSSATGPRVTAWFDPGGKGGDSFRRAVLPQGGTLVGYRAEAVGGDAERVIQKRVTMTAKGELGFDRKNGWAERDATMVIERATPSGAWTGETWLDQCRRADVTFDDAAPGERQGEIRSILAVGSPDPNAGVRIHTKNAAGTREALAFAERVDVVPLSSEVRLSAPSGRSEVYVHQISEARRYFCQRVTVNRDTWEWTDMEGARFE